VPDLKVKSRNSVFRFKGKDVDAQTIGKDLGVSALVSGRVVTFCPSATKRFSVASLECRPGTVLAPRMGGISRSLSKPQDLVTSRATPASRRGWTRI